MIMFTLDEITPCIKDAITGDIVETEVIRLKRKSFLSKFNKKTGWYVNWSKFSSGCEVYALVIKGTVDIQGLISLENDVDSHAVYVRWAVTSPDNNIWQNGSQKYKGVGGHLLAIAAQRSVELGHEGFFHADAMDNEVLKHFITKYNAEKLPLYNRPYHFMFNEEEALKLMEVYDYDWSNEEI